jgi:serine/threonine-protein kinase
MKRCQTCNILGGDNQTVCYADGQPLIEDPVATTLQEAIGAKYTLTRLIGQGAMGAVYGAHHRDLGDVAIKVMLGRGDNQALSERFLREARALRKLRHQNAVLIYDLDRSPTGVTYMVMEMVAGRSLGQDLREVKRLRLDETMEAAEAVCDALAAAHERGIIHRDLKPDNILRAEERGADGRIIRTIKIADFGIVKQRAPQGEGADDEIKLTKFGRPIGTPFYMSPEQWFGDGPGMMALDHRADIYALGCTLYELLAGRPPFVGRTTSELRRQHLHDEPPPLNEVASHVPLALSRVIMRSLAKDRDERQQSVKQFSDELRAAYDESFHGSNREALEQLRSTQEAVIDEPAAQQESSMADTEESVPMFAEKVSAFDPALLTSPQGPEGEQPFPSPAAVIDDAALDDGATEQPPSPEAFAHPQEAAQSPAVEQEALAPGVGVSQASPAIHKAQSRRRPVLIAVAVLLLLGTMIVVAGGLYLYRNRRSLNMTVNVTLPSTQFKPPQIPMSALKGTLRVSAAPGSEIFVDDEQAGTAGTDGIFSLQVPVGLRNVRVVSKNYRPWMRDARVRAQQKTALTAAREPPLEASEAAIDERRKRAQEATEKKDYYAAELEYRALLKDQPDNSAAHNRLGALLAQQQRYGEAIAEFEEAVKLDAKDAESWQTLGRLYLLKARDVEAERAARQFVALAPRDPFAHHLLARALARNADKLDEALNETEAALNIREVPPFLETKAYILLARGSMEEALSTARRAVEIDRSTVATARAAVAVILYRMERVDESVAAYRELRRSDGNDRWGDIRWLELQRGYSRPVLETLSSLIARTN